MNSEWWIQRLNKDEYSSIVKDRKYFFNEPDFCELNRNKVEDVYYLVVMKGNSARFGLIAGKNGNTIRCPFSAPSSYPVTIKDFPKQESVDQALKTLHEYFRIEQASYLEWIFPPFFYDEDILSAWVSALYRQNYKVINLDVNYALDLETLNVDEDAYGSLITEKGRKGYKRAKRNGLRVIRCKTREEYQEAYNIMKAGHETMGYPVRMSFDELCGTMSLVEHDAFIVRDEDDKGIVGEILYRLNSEIVLGVYAGTHPNYRDKNGMNLLTYYTICYYGNLGYKVLDKSISTENSLPNYGLMNFKESVGCKRSLKYSFRGEL